MAFGKACHQSVGADIEGEKRVLVALEYPVPLESGLREQGIMAWVLPPKMFSQHRGFPRGDVLSLARKAGRIDEHCVLEPDGAGTFVHLRGKIGFGARHSLSENDRGIIGH